MVERDVAELKAKVQALEHAVALLARHLGVTIPEQAPSGVSPRVISLVRQGDRLAAVKALVEETGVGLLEAERTIEGLG